MSQKPPMWKPGQDAPRTKPTNKATQPIGAAAVKRVKRNPTPAPPPARTPKDDPDIKPGAGTGRGLPVAAGPSPDGTPAGAPRRPPGHSPFSGYAPTADQLGHQAAAGEESSNQVMAIVMGMLFMLISASIVVFLILAIGLFTWTTATGDGLAGADEDKGHIRDTAAGEVIPIEKRKPRPRKPGTADPDEVVDGEDPEAGGPVTGPVTIYVPEHVFFHTMEINCPDAGIRRRASFRGRKASTTGVPIREQCIVTFQGSQPAKTFVSGDQVKDCISFNPTECRQL